jgi:hypothetical protein
MTEVFWHTVYHYFSLRQPDQVITGMGIPWEFSNLVNP